MIVRDDVQNAELTAIICAAFPGEPWHPTRVRPRRIRRAWARFLYWARYE